ncbi:hypothetical protein QTP88_016903 [Uroleucon formosanum]
MRPPPALSRDGLTLTQDRATASLCPLMAPYSQKRAVPMGVQGTALSGSSPTFHLLLRWLFGGLVFPKSPEPRYSKKFKREHQSGLQQLSGNFSSLELEARRRASLRFYTADPCRVGLASNSLTCLVQARPFASLYSYCSGSRPECPRSRYRSCCPAATITHPGWWVHSIYLLTQFPRDPPGCQGEPGPQHQRGPPNQRAPHFPGRYVGTSARGPPGRRAPLSPGRDVVAPVRWPRPCPGPNPHESCHRDSGCRVIFAAVVIRVPAAALSDVPTVALASWSTAGDPVRPRGSAFCERR